MSSRRKNDFYPTPGWATEILLNKVTLKGDILECCSGRNDITNVLRKSGHTVYTNDIDPEMPADSHQDATDPLFWLDWLDLLHQGRVADWVVSNPPFSVAHLILPPALDVARVGMAMMLRLSYLEPCKNRADWLVAFPPSEIIVLPRISFTGNGKTDVVTCAWFVWEKGRSEQRISIVSKNETGAD